MVTATVVHRVLFDLGFEGDVLLWNAVPTHPHLPGRPDMNRRPTRGEIQAGLRFVAALSAGRTPIAVGRVAESALGRPAVRHPSHGGAAAFREGLRRILRRG